ncbi:MAG: hypothetical protein ISS66_15580 [Desulfobacteraceae bacterium]|nr:hypothetical protein [Desulfobacteraceae bacterium]
MAYNDRKITMKEIEELRDGRRLISICNFDRNSIPVLLGPTTQFYAEFKEALYRILKETYLNRQGLDIFLYTRGGDTNSVWPIVCLLREYDPDFEVLVPFRAHSSGTLFSIAAKKILMCRLGELSPIDPTTGNQFNPVDPSVPGNRMGISVEDVSAYEKYVKQALMYNECKDEHDDSKRDIRNHILPFLEKFTNEVHPLAIGNVHRVYLQIRELASMLLALHRDPDKDLNSIIKKLTTQYYSHLHMIGRGEAKDILGKQVEYAPDEMETLLDKLLRQYEDDFYIREPFIAANYMKDETKEDVSFVGGVIEAIDLGYKYVTKGVLYQSSQIPSNVKVQLPPGQKMPIVEGLPRQYRLELSEQGWRKNKQQDGVTK